MVERMLLYLYTLDYSLGPLTTGIDGQINTFEALDRKASLLVHVTMYALGDQILIPSLKEKARNRFYELLQNIWPVPGLPEIAQEIFTSTPPSDRGLSTWSLQFVLLMPSRSF